MIQKALLTEKIKNIQTNVYRYLQIIKRDYFKDDEKHLSFTAHVGRKTRVTNLLIETGSSYITKKLLNWSKESMLNRYDQLADEKLVDMYFKAKAKNKQG